MCLDEEASTCKYALGLCSVVKIIDNLNTGYFLGTVDFTHHVLIKKHVKLNASSFKGSLITLNKYVSATNLLAISAFVKIYFFSDILSDSCVINKTLKQQMHACNFILTLW